MNILLTQRIDLKLFECVSDTASLREKCLVWIHYDRACLSQGTVEDFVMKGELVPWLGLKVLCRSMTMLSGFHRAEMPKNTDGMECDNIRWKVPIRPDLRNCALRSMHSHISWGVWNMMLKEWPGGFKRLHLANESCPLCADNNGLHAFCFMWCHATGRNGLIRDCGNIQKWLQHFDIHHTAQGFVYTLSPFY